MEDNLEEPVDMEIMTEGMEQVADIKFEGIAPNNIFPSLDKDDDQVALYDDGVKGTILPEHTNEESMLDTKRCSNVNSGINDSQYFAADKCNGTETVLAVANGVCAEVVQTHQNMSDVFPPDFSMWTAEDDLLLKNAVESGTALEALAKGVVRFSSRFTVKELRERWHALLYNPEISAKAAAGMVEIELSHMGLTKTSRFNKLKGNYDVGRKQRLDNVRNHYYQMRKRIDAERNVPLDDNFTLPNDIVAACMEAANDVMQDEGAAIHEGLPVTDGIQEASVAASCGLSKANFEIEDKMFSQMFSLLADGGAEVDYYDPPVMLSATSVVRGDDYISTENIHHAENVPHLVKDMPQSVVHNAVIVHDGSYSVESCLDLDTVRTTLTIDNVPTVNPVYVINHNASDFKSIDGEYVKSEGFAREVPEENVSGLDIRNWETDKIFLISSVTADVKHNAYGTMLTTKVKEDTSGHKESCRDEHLVLSSFPAKEQICPSSKLIQSIASQVHHEPLQQSASGILPVLPGKSEPLLFIDGPMECAFNTEDLDVPCNDDFNPLAYQQPSSKSAFVQSTYVDHTVALSSLSCEGNIGHPVLLGSGMPVVKEEPKTLEPFVEAGTELQPLFLKDGGSNKSFAGYHQVKTEVTELAGPSVVCQEVFASKDDCHPGISSPIGSKIVLPIGLQEGISRIPSVLESCHNKFDLLSSLKSMQGPLHSNDGSIDFPRPMQFDASLPTLVQDMRESQGMFVDRIEHGLKDLPVMSCEEAAENLFPGNVEYQHTDSDEELPHYSDVEAMILDMDLDPVDDKTFSAWAESKRLYKQHRKVIVRLEQCSNANMQRFLASKGAYALFYGHHLQYFITKKEVTIGRVTQENIVDIDLGKEGPANKVSRRQATIKLKEDGQFHLENHGGKAIAVNSRALTKGQRIRLCSNCLIEVGGMRFIFEMNRRLIKEQIQQSRLHG